MAACPLDNYPDDESEYRREQLRGQHRKLVLVSAMAFLEAALKETCNKIDKRLFDDCKNKAKKNNEDRLYAAVKDFFKRIRFFDENRELINSILEAKDKRNIIIHEFLDDGAEVLSPEYLSEILLNITVLIHKLWRKVPKTSHP